MIHIHNDDQLSFTEVIMLGGSLLSILGAIGVGIFW
jgi:hypothetical protein